jgi:hypothetical protein
MADRFFEYVAGWRPPEHSFRSNFEVLDRNSQALVFAEEGLHRPYRFLSTKKTHAGNDPLLIVDRDQITSVNFHLNNPHSG